MNEQEHYKNCENCTHRGVETAPCANCSVGNMNIGDTDNWMPIPIEVKSCAHCGRDYMSDRPECVDHCTVCIDTEQVIVDGYVPRLQDSLAYDSEYQEWAKKERLEREEFQRKQLNKHLKWYHKPLFFFFEKLADYFAPRVKIINQQPSEGYQGGHYGVEIYGKIYLKGEKGGKEYV